MSSCVCFACCYSDTDNLASVCPLATPGQSPYAALPCMTTDPRSLSHFPTSRCYCDCFECSYSYSSMMVTHVNSIPTPCRRPKSHSRPMAAEPRADPAPAKGPVPCSPTDMQPQTHKHLDSTPTAKGPCILLSSGRASHRHLSMTSPVPDPTQDQPPRASAPTRIALSSDRIRKSLFYFVCLRLPLASGREVEAIRSAASR